MPLFGAKSKKIRAVVVEDHHALLELTKEVLERTKKFEIVGQAANGEEAIQVCAQTKPELVLLDLKMPGKDGFQALPEIRKVSPTSRVVAYSMLPREHSEQRVLSLGAELFIEKSVDSSELVERLLALFSGADGNDGHGPGPPGKKRLGTFSFPLLWRLPSMARPA